MATKFDIIELKALKGDTEYYQFTITEGSSAKDLSSYTVTANGKLETDSPSNLWTSSIADATDGSNFASGIVVLKLTATQTNSLPTLCLFEVEAVDGAEVLTLARGKIEAID